MKSLSINQTFSLRQILPGRVSFLFFTLILTLFTDAQDYPKVPDRPAQEKLVNLIGNKNDVRNFLSAEEIKKLEYKLDTFSRNTSNQICIVIVDTLNGLAAAEYASQLGLKWGIGMKDKDNGVVLVICPTAREIFIAPSNRLQGIIPDLRAKQIIDKIIVPNLKAGDNFEALDEACNLLIQLCRGEVNEVDKRVKQSPEKYGKIILIVILIILFFGIFGKFGGGTTIGRGGSYRHGGGFGGFGGFGGGSGGGGFGGFGGGGGFNGGGAGGKW